MHWGGRLCCVATRARPAYHCRVAAADELSHLVKDALTVDAFVEGAPLHDDGHGQQDLLANILLEAVGREGGEGYPSARGARATSENGGVVSGGKVAAAACFLWPVSRRKLFPGFFFFCTLLRWVQFNAGKHYFFRQLERSVWSAKTVSAQRNTKGGQVDHGAMKPCRQCLPLASLAVAVVAGALRGSDHHAGCRPDSVWHDWGSTLRFSNSVPTTEHQRHFVHSSSSLWMTTAVGWLHGEFHQLLAALRDFHIASQNLILSQSRLKPDCSILVWTVANHIKSDFFFFLQNRQKTTTFTFWQICLSPNGSKHTNRFWLPVTP